MADRSWKRHERETARRLGGTRTGVNRQRESAGVPDVDCPHLSVECKHRRMVPLWLKEAVDAARIASRPEQLPIAVIHEHGDRRGNDLVVLRMSDFQDWHGGVADG